MYVPTSAALRAPARRERVLEGVEAIEDVEELAHGGDVADVEALATRLAEGATENRAEVHPDRLQVSLHLAHARAREPTSIRGRNCNVAHAEIVADLTTQRKGPDSDPPSRPAHKKKTRPVFQHRRALVIDARTPTTMQTLTAPAKGRAKVVRDAFRMLLHRTAGRVIAGTRSHGTLSMQRAHVEYFTELLGARTPLELVDARRIARALAVAGRGRRVFADGQRPLSGGTLRKYASTIRQALVLARGRAPKLPELPYRYRPRAGHLPDFEAYQRLRDALPLHRRLWFVVAVWTGQRLSDVERMRREDLDPDAGWVRIRSTKTKRPAQRFTAAPELLRELADHWRALPPGAKLVPAWSHVSSQLARLSERLQLPRMTAHNLRHTFFTWFVGANGFTPELLELGGWKDLTIPALVYAHAAPVRLAEQMQRTHQLVVERRSPQKISREREPEPTSFGAVPKRSGAVGVRPPTAPDTCPEGPPSDQDGSAGVPAQVAATSVGPAGIEPATRGLKVRLVPDSVGGFVGATTKGPPCQQPLRAPAP
jgi:integrase